MTVKTVFSTQLPLWGLALAAAATLITVEARPGGAQPNAGAGVTMPAYDDSGQLLLPADYREWIFAGSSLGLSYSTEPVSHEMFHHTLIEPSAYRHFSKTGEFREGTMLVLMLHGTGENVLPGRQGRFADEVHGVEMAVKDSGRFDSGWAYFGFGGMGGIRDRAEAFPSAACANCHSEHAAHDNVFLQFYPLLAEAAPDGMALVPTSEADREEQAAEAGEPHAGTPLAPLALNGLDPVMLVAGREEMGKPEIEMTVAGRRYRFASEPNRAQFEKDGAHLAIRNEDRPVVPGADPDPEIR